MYISKKWIAELKRRSGGRGAKTADAGILGCGELEKNPLPGLELCEGARDLCGWMVAGRAAIFCVKALFLVTFFEPAKKVTPPEGDALSLPKWQSFQKFSGMKADSYLILLHI